jgi:hypothetical protein
MRSRHLYHAEFRARHLAYDALSGTEMLPLSTGAHSSSPSGHDGRSRSHHDGLVVAGAPWPATPVKGIRPLVHFEPEPVFIVAMRTETDAIELVERAPCLHT